MFSDIVKGQCYLVDRGDKNSSCSVASSGNRAVLVPRGVDGTFDFS